MMKKIIANVNREIGGLYWDRYIAGKLKPIERKLYRTYKWVRHFIPYEWFIIDEVIIYESKDDELWIEDDEMGTIIGAYIEA